MCRKRGGEGILRRNKSRRHLPKIRTFQNSGKFFLDIPTDRQTERQTDRQTDRPTDRQTGIVAKREVTLSKIIVVPKFIL